MGFKFLNKDNELNLPTEERFNELVNHRLTTDNRPAVFLRLERNIDTISEDEWNSIIKQQRHLLMNLMWENGMVSHNIISQDENGFSLRTEINF